MKLVVASSNAHKIAEISAIACAFGYSVVSRAEVGVPEFEIEETGTTFEENSLLKARAIYDWLGGEAATVADDSGIEVDALDGAPGVYSARFAEFDTQNIPSLRGDRPLVDEAIRLNTPDSQDRANNQKLLDLLAEVPMDQRTARFVSVITCLRPGKPPLVCRGEVEGHVDFKESGTAGFGYDPLFIPLGYEYSFGLFTPEDKNAISHRSRALTALVEKLKTEIE